MSSITSLQLAGGPSVPPDWQTIQHDVKCPLCDYNLRGLSECRCPECGHSFDWPSVLDPTKHRHPYLFEHHAKGHVRSFAQTVLHHLDPIGFWKTLRPTHQIKAGGIILYWAACAATVLLPAVAGIAELVRYRYRWLGVARGYRLGNMIHAALGRDGERMTALSVILLALFPWLNFAALMIFQQSMRRAKVKAGHVLRCAIYSGDVIFWYALAATATISCFGPNLRPKQTEHLLFLLTLEFLLAAAINAVRLWIAYAHYLKFKAALATVLASQIIVGLTIFTIFIYFMTH